MAVDLSWGGLDAFGSNRWSRRNAKYHTGLKGL